MSKAVTIGAGSLTAQNTYSTPVELRGDFNISISGTWVATVTLQRSFDEGSNYVDVDSFTSNQELTAFEPEPGVIYRIGPKTGDFTSGTIVVRLSK